MNGLTVLSVEDMPHTFIIADNQYITRVGLHGLIDGMFDNSEMLDVRNKMELLDLLRVHSLAVVVLDYALFDFNGVEDLLVIHGRFPLTRWILFSNDLSESLIRRLSGENNISMLLKESDGEEICMALKSAVSGERFLCRQIAGLLLSVNGKENAKTLLTATETEILKLVAHGKSVKEIAELRVSSVHTIVTHKKNIFRKLGVNNVYEATRYALRAGLVDFVEYYI